MSIMMQKKQKQEVQVKRKTRLYCDSNLNLGFTCCGDQAQPLPVCLICKQKLSNEAIVPSKLKRHFTRKHRNLSYKPCLHKFSKYLPKLRRPVIQQQKLLLKTQSLTPKQSTLSFYKQMPLDEFWIKVETEYSCVVKKAIVILLQFCRLDSPQPTNKHKN